MRDLTPQAEWSNPFQKQNGDPLPTAQYVLPFLARDATNRRVRERKSKRTILPLIITERAEPCSRCNTNPILRYCPHGTPQGYTHGPQSDMRERNHGPYDKEGKCTFDPSTIPETSNHRVTERYALARILADEEQREELDAILASL